jgi:hypothetical protein
MQANSVGHAVYGYQPRMGPGKIVLSGQYLGYFSGIRDWRTSYATRNGRNLPILAKKGKKNLIVVKKSSKS